MAVALTINETTRAVDINVYNNSVGANVVEAVYTGTVTHSTTSYTDLLIGGLTKKVVPASTSWVYEIKVVGITANGLKQFGYSLTGAIKRDNSTNISIVGSNREVRGESDSNFNAKCVTDNTDYALQVQVADTGAAGDTVKWVAYLKAVRVTF